MKVHKRAAAGICHDKEWVKGEQFHLCFHLKILVQEDTTQGCTMSLSAAQGAPGNTFPPPAPSAHPRLLEWSHSGGTNVPVCCRVPMAPLLTSSFPAPRGAVGILAAPQSLSVLFNHHSTPGVHPRSQALPGVSQQPQKSWIGTRGRLQKAAGVSPRLQCLPPCKTQQVRASAGDNEHNLLIPAQEAAGMAATKS